MLYICNVFSASFSLPLITSLKQTHLFFLDFLEYFLLFLALGLASGSCLDFALFFAKFRLALLIKVLLIKKACS